MNVILSSVKRTIDGFISKGFLDDFSEAKVLVVEPTFIDFKAATSNQLSYLLQVAEKASNVSTLVFCIHYSNDNAKRFKGYLIDLNTEVMKNGFESMNQYHVPWASYGTGITGSSLLLVYSKTKFLYKPAKRYYTAKKAYPELHSHAIKSAPQVMLNVAGGGVASGFVLSSESLLPSIELWSAGVLECELVEGESLRRDTVPMSVVYDLFGVDEGEKVMSFVGLTPKQIILTLKGIKYFAPMKTSK